MKEIILLLIGLLAILVIATLAQAVTVIPLRVPTNVSSNAPWENGTVTSKPSINYPPLPQWNDKSPIFQ